MIGKTNALAGMKQKQEMVNISLSSNQASHEDLVGAVITLSYGEYTEEIVWSGNEVTRAVPAYVEYTVSFGDVENHKTPAAVTNTSVEGNVRSITGTYLTELVSVTLSADDGASMAGQTVTINGTEHTFDGNAVEQKVAYGVTYTVSVSDKDGYAAPNAQTFTAAQSGRNLELVYIASALKVNILSNQENDENIAAVKAIVTYGDTSVEVSNGQQIGIPTNVEVTITFPEVEGYKTPDAISFTNSGGMVEKTVTYLTEVLTVNVGADNGTPTGYEVTISKHDTVGVATKYTKLEYIESNGTQYVDTGFIPNQDTRVVMDVEQLSSTSSFYFGARTSDTSNTFSMVQLNGTSLRSDYGTERTTSEMNVLQRLLIDKNKNVLTVGDTIITASAQTFSAPSNLVLLSTNTNGTVYSPTASAKLYSCQIYDNGELIRDYIPALRADGIAGLYDVVNDTFYASSGSGNFIASSVVDEVIAVQTSVTGTYKIPFDSSYQISASTVAGFDAPSVQTFIADSVSRVVDVTYTEVKAETLTVNVNADDGASVDGQNVSVQSIPNVDNGVYIQDIEGKLWTESAWDGSKTPNGIAVVTDECQFVMAVENAYSSSCRWGGYGTEVSGIATTTDSSTAATDYAGEANTTTIINALNGTNDGYADGAPAAEYCRAYTFPNGQVGYLGAAGEWRAVLDNKDTIESALSKCGGTSMSTGYWTSTQYSSIYSWNIGFIYMSFSNEKKSVISDVRAFAPLTTTDTQPVTNGKATFTIPYDTEYTVSVDEKSGYTSPASQTFTASQATRSITMTYEAPKVENLIVNVTSSDGSSTDGQVVTVKSSNVTASNGVYIQDVNGKLWTESEWDGSVTPNGVAVIDTDCSFVIALNDAYSTTCKWGGYGTLLSDIVTTTSSASAKVDYDGVKNMGQIYSQLSSNAIALGYCMSYEFPNKRKGYLGSAGEWTVALKHKSSITSALSACGGTAMSTQYWSSTQYHAYNVWYEHWTNSSLDFTSKDGLRSVRAFCSLNGDNQPVSNGKASFTIPVGVTYEVSVSAKDSYITPASKTYTAASGSRTVTMNYVYHAGTTNPTNGVYIQDTDGFCHTADAWTGTYTPNGIAVITDNCRFVMALGFAGTGGAAYKWGGRGTTVDGILTTTAKTTAVTDYAGESNTKTIVDSLNGVTDSYGSTGAPAAEACLNYTFPNGKNGYLGSMGEWKAVIDNTGAINVAIEAATGIEGALWEGGSWTSTQYNANNSWLVSVSTTLEYAANYKSGSKPVRAFTTL